MKILIATSLLLLNFVRGFNTFQRYPMTINPNTKSRIRSSVTALSSNEISSESELEKTKDGVYICKEMPPSLPADLKNTYYLLRHGQSWGNVEGVISSARSLATSEKHGLTPLGYDQGRASAKELLKLVQQKVQKSEVSDNKPKRVFFYSSPFARARQTAEACLEGLSFDDNKKTASELNLNIQDDMIIEDGLMERFFGNLDDQAIHTYAYVWPKDMLDPLHVGFEVESVAAVSTRLRETILKIDQSPVHDSTDDNSEGDIVILTSHADVLQIMQLYAAGAENVGKFSSYRFTNGEVREMGRTVDTLPEPQPLEPPKAGT
mmetsp:Transcript_17659/g.20105  ORF Transcript_17659/g.20105 Transcript_17659/m.20105 type:complete len:320 (+) Transcript_17659:70-1029(+)